MNLKLPSFKKNWGTYRDVPLRCIFNYPLIPGVYQLAGLEGLLDRISES